MGKVTVRLYEKPGYADGGLVQAAEAVRGHGRWGDEILIHVNPEEFAQMKEMWGDPTINPHTGLPEYGFLSKLFKGIKKALKVVAPIALNFIPGVGTAISGALGALGVAKSAIPLATAITKGAIGGGISGGGKGALVGGLTGGLGGGAGIASKLGMGRGALQTAFGDALASGAASAAGGGDFGKGALYGGLGSLALPYVNNAVANTGLGKSLGFTMAPTLTQPGGYMDGLSEYTSMNQTGPEINTLSDGTQEVVVNGKPLGKEIAPAGLSSPVAFRSNETSTALNSLVQPSVGAEDPGPEQTPEKGSFLDKAFGYAVNHPLQAATLISGLAGLGGTKQPEPSGPVDTSNSVPLPQFAFNRQRDTSYDDFYTYGMRPEKNFYTNNGPPTKMADGGLTGLKKVGRGKWVDPETYGPDLVEDYHRVTPNHSKLALGLTSVGEMISTSKGHLQKMLSDNYRRDAARSQIRSEYDEEVKGNSPARGNPFKKRMADGGLSALGGRSDRIDAKLSPGEYVVDAETVALLGDGSTSEGAAKLDRLRAKVRQHKGKALAKGKISPNAKEATSYLRSK